MNDLREVEKEPEFLVRSGFTCREQDTSDVVRWVWFEKVFDSLDSQIRLVVQVEFELSIYDDPFASYAENRWFSFNGIYLRVIDRQMEFANNIWDVYDAETECPREIDRWKLPIYTMSRLRSLCEMLGGKI